MVNWAIGVPVISVLISGTFAALSNKGLYDFKAEGSCGRHSFEKPYFLCLAMFIGEALCLIVYYWNEWWRLESSKIWMARLCCSTLYKYDADLAKRRREREREALAHGIEPYKDTEPSPFSDDEVEEDDEEKSLLGSGPNVAQPSPSFRQRTLNGQLDQDLLDLHLSEEEHRRRREANKPSKFIYLGLCLFDLTASAAGGVGLLYIDASSNQMLRGSSVVFTALLSMVILRRRLTWRQWGGIAAVCLGLVMVGMCGLFRANALLASKATTTAHSQVTPQGALLGLLLVLGGSALNSIQNVFEELLVKRVGHGSIDALEIVGWEGIWGILITGGIVLPVVNAIPGSNCGSIESWVDTWHLMTHSSIVFLLVLGYTISLSVMNAHSVVLSQVVSAVFRQLVNALRVVFIWAISILMFYVWTHRTMGESWDVYSYLQLGGFAMLIIGTIVYGTKETTVDDDDNALFIVDPNAPDSPEPSKKHEVPTAPAEIVDEYDENGVRLPKDGVAIPVNIHIGQGRPKQRTKRSARSPGVETFALPDVRDQDSADDDELPAHGGNSSSSRRAQAGIRLDDQEEL